MQKVFVVLLILTPAALFAAYTHVPAAIVFVLSALAIVPLAKFIGDATDHLASRTSPAIGGILNATFGNATELIIGVLAIQQGLIEVVKAAITGSIIGNLLLVLGTAMYFGGLKREKQVFNATAAKASASTLLLAVISLVIPAIFSITSGDASGNTIVLLSVFVAALMIMGYVANLFFILRTHKHLYLDSVEAGDHTWSLTKSVAVLLAATIAVSFVSDALVNTIQPVIAQFGWTQIFIGVIVVAIVGNAAEHTSAIQAAMRNRMDLSLSIAVGSATQIALFVAPVLVLVSLVLGHPMDLVFRFFELVVLIFSVLVTNAVIEDGESNWFEGVQLLAAYVIMAVAFFLYV